MATPWKRLGPSNGRQWPGTWAGAAAAMGVGAALGGLPPPLLAVLGSLSAALAAFSGWWTLMQRRDAQRRGTVYVIREPGTPANDEWEQDEAQAQEFIRTLQLSFPEVRQIPGPSELHRWPWPLGQGAELWDHYVDELVTALRVVRRGDNPKTQKSLVVWARWPVAIATVARLLSAERGPLLGIRQRVSYGRSPRMEYVDPAQAALNFDPAGAEGFHPEAWDTGARPPRHRLTPGTRGNSRASAPGAKVFTHHGTVTVSGRPGRAQPSKTKDPSDITILLIRLTAQPWGPLTSEPGHDGQLGRDGIKIEVDDAEGIGIDGIFHLEIREWRCLPTDPRAKGAHGWSQFETLAEEVTSWVAAQVPARPDCPVLLGAVMPQEIGLGMGVHIHGRNVQEWPSRLFPLVWNGRCFVIPHLDLGWESLRTARRNTAPNPSPELSGRGRLRSWLELVRR